MQMNIVLIGMPSSGKTTIGRLLAEELGMDFLDTDAVVRVRENMELSDIVNSFGMNVFLEMQEKAIADLELRNCVVATGGSAVYSDCAMKRLKKAGIAVYLKVDFAEFSERVDQGRRFARKDGQSLLEMYNERTPLYEKYADIIVDCNGINEKTASLKVSAAVNDYRSENIAE